MIIEIKENTFKSNNFKGLNYLIQILTYKQRYELFVELAIVRYTGNYQKLDFDDQKVIEDSYNKIVQEGTTPKYFVSESNVDGNVFCIEEAIRFFNQPVSVILENSLNDQRFLCAIIKHFDSAREVQRHLDNGWIQFENAGGCTNVINFIQGKLHSFNNLSHRHNKDNRAYLRCFVLLDSDKEYPLAPTKPELEKLLAFLNKNDIKSHILEKRCMENYMPDEVFNDIAYTAELKKWFDAYHDLSNEQKDFLNIPDGFSSKNPDGTPKSTRNVLKRDVQDLYSDVSQPNYETLDRGFKMANFNTTFPRYFEHRQVDKLTLQSRCGNTNELQGILNKIADLL